MADKKISELGISTGALDADQYIEIYDSAEALPADQNKKRSFSSLKTELGTHTQNTDTILDEGGTNEISAAQLVGLEGRSGYVPFSYLFTTSTTGDPGTGYFGTNNTWNNTLYLNISKTDHSGRDLSDVLALMVVGSFFQIQVRNKQTYSLLVKVDAVTDNTTYYTFTTTNYEGTAIIPASGSLCGIAMVPKASAGSWGSITGTLSAQTDLQTELDEIAVNAGNIADLEAVVTQRALYSATTTGTVALDCSTFDSWYRILTGNTSFTFTNTPPANITFVRTLEVITTAGESLTFPTADNVIGTFVNDDTTVNLITINFANYPTLGLRITVVIS